MKEEHAAAMAEVKQRAAAAEAEVKIKTDIIAQYFPAVAEQPRPPVRSLEFDPERGEAEPHAGSTPRSVSTASSESGESRGSDETAGVPL
eukprot:3361015-Rhodomonas_salina.1